MGGAGRRCAVVRLQHLTGGNRIQQATSIQGLQGGRIQAAQAKGQAFQGRLGRRCLLQQQDRTAGLGQLAGQEQADRAGPGDDDVVQHGISL